MSHRFSQNAQIHQKHQNDVLRDNMNMGASAETYGGSCLAEVHCLNHQIIGLKWHCFK